MRIDYVNWRHGGRHAANYIGDGGAPDYGELLRLMSVGAWPGVLALGEADRYRFNGGQCTWEAIAALRSVGSPPYQPLWGRLPDRGGPFAPMLLVDPTQIIVNRWYDDLLPDAAARTDNTLLATDVSSGVQFRLVVVHLDIHNGDERLREVRRFDRFSRHDAPTFLVGDFNSTPSGPWVPDDLNDPRVDWLPMQRSYRALFQHGPAQGGPLVHDTRALDYLIGYWKSPCVLARLLASLRHRRVDGRRVGGLGYLDVAEMACDYTPTQHPRVNGSAPRAVDRMLVNQLAAGAYVPGSYTVFPPLDPTRPDADSDHKRITAEFDLSSPQLERIALMTGLPHG
ncbi:endonuclease/exonuclease/phosphatase family protein [Actinomadura hibisca]|uniref:endonuclease/exonuclease/phosphatase family protein n=1 Tax=Actinomadura hibisca TaxID=68565 RepID=UPI0008367696|nr:endonuclease/exonuclease/phosphatase family protein [Actinomadura hibisca]